MKPHVVSSAELIGQPTDAMAMADLLAAKQSFDLWMKADELRDRIVVTPSYSPQAYIGLMMLGPFLRAVASYMVISIQCDVKFSSKPSGAPSFSYHAFR